MASSDRWVAQFDEAKGAHDAVVLEGIHALKHALRFGAEVITAVTPDKPGLLRLARRVAPDVSAQIERLAHDIPSSDFEALSRRPPASPALAVARARVPRLADLPDGLLVVLYEPRHQGNAGAAIRVAAAAEAAGVIFAGSMDPWTSPVLRSSAGLHYATSVVRASWPLQIDRPLVAFDPDEGDTDYFDIPPNAALLFGGEREGLPRSLLAKAERVVRIPMRPGVSSLNLATSVAIALYSRTGR